MEKDTRGRKAPRAADLERMSREQRRIAQWLKSVKFRRSLFGVSEKDVWKKISELNDMYNAALIAERARYDALLVRQAADAEAALIQNLPEGREGE